MKQNFRAWKKKEKKMIQPKRLMAIGLQTEVVVEQVENGDFLVPYSIPFENVVVMQSTGLKDKNGKEIFEGDIVTDGEFARIVQYHQTLGFYMFDEEGDERFFSDSATLEDFGEDAKIVSEILEVIGNIYENPEYDQNFVGFRIKGE